MHKDADEVKIVSGLKLKWNGVFNLSDLYQKTKMWLDYEGYGDEKKNFKEERYIERVKPGGKQLEIVWKGEKNLSDYFSNVIQVNFQFLGLNDIEMQQDGKKKKMQKANVTIEFNASLIKNRQGKWPRDSLMKKIYEKFVVRKRIEGYSIDFYNQIYSFHNEVKTYLNLSEF